MCPIVDLTEWHVKGSLRALSCRKLFMKFGCLGSAIKIWYCSTHRIIESGYQEVEIRVTGFPSQQLCLLLILKSSYLRGKKSSLAASPDHYRLLSFTNQQIKISISGTHGIPWWYPLPCLNINQSRQELRSAEGRGLWDV